MRSVLRTIQAVLRLMMLIIRTMSVMRFASAMGNMNLIRILVSWQQYTCFHFYDDLHHPTGFRS